jgi:hypothetical protein
MRCTHAVANMRGDCAGCWSWKGWTRADHSAGHAGNQPFVVLAPEGREPLSPISVVVDSTAALKK